MPPTDLKRNGLRGTTLTQWLVIAIVAGVLTGSLAPKVAQALASLVTVFLRIITALIVPLVFSTLVAGIAKHGNSVRHVGRLALRSVVYSETVTILAMVVGLTAVNVAKPGIGVQLAGASGDEFREYAARIPAWDRMFDHAVPQSIFDAAISNNVLQVVPLALLFGVAVAKVQGRSRTLMLDAMQSLREIMFKLVALVMAFAPLAVGAAVAVTVSRSGIGVFGNLAQLVGTVYAALLAFVLLVLVPIAMLARVPLRPFLSTVRSPFLVAFAMASREAALPQAMQSMQEFGVSRRILGFVLPTGHSLHVPGSMVYLAIASVFAAQAAAIDMSLGQQLLMMLTVMLMAKGVAGVPHASLVILSGALTNFGLPLEAVAVIIGVDVLMDMARTSVNVFGNCLASAIVGRWEGELS